ncbi:terpene synthase family protein, partial [Nocardia tengchongensis]|uniref:terpene synthase family protein n=1 Tax=Nocardia tengchongensis TaxID=2055889 RepID=UPI0036870F67
RMVRAEILEWWWSYYTESVRTITRDLPKLDEYRTHRQISVAIYMLLDLSEITYGIDLPDAVRQLPALKTLRAAVTEHMGLINDVHSLPADEAVGYAYNAVLLAEYHFGCTRAHALRVVNELLTDCIVRIGHLEEALAEELDVLGIAGQTRADIMHTLEDYRRYVRANFDFHYRAPRYTSPPIEALEHGQLLS